MKTDNNHSSRDLSLDIARGIAIFLVIFGHITHIPALRSYIWSFHIPLFFFISGLLFSRQKHGSSAVFFRSRIKGLLIPYVVFYLLTLLYWILIERRTRGGDCSVGSQVFGLFYGTYSLDYMYFNGALWFIPCLFSIQLIHWFVSKLGDWRYVLAVMLLLNVIGLSLMQYLAWLPWGINAAMIAGIYYSMGDASKGLYKKSDVFRWPVTVCIIVAGIAVQYCLSSVAVTDLAALRIGSPVLYIPVAVVGIITYCMLSKLIAHNALLEWLGRNSLVLFAFQEPVYRAVIFAVSKLLHADAEFVRQDVWLCLACAVITILAIWPLTLVWNRYAKTLLYIK